IGRRAFVGKIRKNLPELVEHLPDLPHKLHTIIDDAARGRLEIKWRSKELEMLRKQLRYNQRNTISAISGGAMLLSGTLVLIFGSGSLLPVSLATALGIGLGAGGGFLLIKSWFDITDKKAVSRYKL
ncbi:MAG: ubiquinone biosynthesis regulatory protein kinase UbiB, partial [Candidatus Thiodiazotropha sp.]